jgi:hypothetical protein
MAQPRGKKGRGGLLIRGADGSLWFMSDDANEPVKVKDDLAKRIDGLLERQAPRQISGVSPDIQKLLGEQFNLPDFWGIIIWWSTRLPQ